MPRTSLAPLVRLLTTRQGEAVPSRAAAAIARPQPLFAAGFLVRLTPAA